MIQQQNEIPSLFAQIGTEQFWLRYGRNPWHRFRMLVYPGLFILLMGILFSLLLLQDKLVSSRYERERLISRLQLQSIKNQLDPHFTFNALNAVGSLIYKEEKDLAYRYLKGLTDLLRMVSGDASTILWTLADELGFVKKYLEIEKLRFRERFNYSVEVEQEGLNDMHIPKMSILTFVENAIKHGLKHKKGTGMLEIRVKSLGKGFSISVRDNGIGRAAALKYREGSSGQGIEMMKQYFRQFSESTGQLVQFKVMDLFDHAMKASGTLVEITIE
jgi:LytS/YehU family sensor histidine kinase